MKTINWHMSTECDGNRSLSEEEKRTTVLVVLVLVMLSLLQDEVVFLVPKDAANLMRG